MSLVSDIITACLDEDKAIPSILRKCLVLGHQLNNNNLSEWANRELNGYSHDDVVPDDRIVSAIAKGTLIGPFGSYLKSQPIPSAALKPIHREFAQRALLRQPIAAYILFDAKSQGVPSLEWPPDLTLYYQDKIMENYALNRVWQEIPTSCMGLVDSVRNRVLQFALEIQAELGPVGNEPSSLPSETVSTFVTNIIYGGQNVIGSTTRDVQQLGAVTITQGDFGSLSAALKNLGVDDEEISNLKEAFEADGS